jgi:HlyD family secretion protein
MSNTSNYKFTMRKNILTILLFGAVVFFTGTLTSCGGPGGSTKVSVDTADTRTIIETVSASGKIQPETEVKIASDVSGEIVELYVEEGDSVKKGQLLMEINPDVYKSEYERMVASLSQTKANLESAKARQTQQEAQLLQAENTYNMNKTLHDKKAISETEWNTINTNYKVAQSNVLASKQEVTAMQYSVQSVAATVKSAQTNLSRTRIYAPMDGIVSMLNVKKGERVVGTATMAGTEMLRIADLSIMEVNVEVNENDIVKVDLGDTALVEVDAYLNRKFKGIVTSIANSPKTANNAISTDEVTNFEVKIRILKDSYNDLLTKKNVSPFRPGMSATVDIITGSINNAVSIPIQSVTAKKDTLASTGDDYKEYVFVVEDKKVKMILVKTGIQDNKYIQILSGITKGQIVVEGPYDAISRKLEDGMKITVTDKKSLYGGKK